MLIKYTYYGDANLSGAVDGSDYSLVDNGFLHKLTGWYNGDFNFDGVVNGSDYTLIDNAYNRQTASLASQVATPATAVAATSNAKPALRAIFSQMPVTPATMTTGSAITPDSVADGIFGDGGVKPRKTHLVLPV